MTGLQSGDDSSAFAANYGDRSATPSRGDACHERTSVEAGFWPNPGVRERRLSGGPTRTPGFKQGDRKREGAPSTNWDSRVTPSPPPLPQSQPRPATLPSTAPRSWPRSARASHPRLPRDSSSASAVRSCGINRRWRRPSAARSGQHGGQPPDSAEQLELVPVRDSTGEGRRDAAMRANAAALRPCRDLRELPLRPGLGHHAALPSRDRRVAAGRVQRRLAVKIRDAQISPARSPCRCFRLASARATGEV